MRRWLAVVGIGGAVVAAGVAYARRLEAPRSALGDAVGVRRSRPVGFPFCGWFVVSTRVGDVPTGEEVCGWARPATDARRAELDELSYDVLTRRVRSAARSWERRDSATWIRDLDSIRVALAQQGGTPTCAQWTVITASGVRAYWQFPGFQVKLFSGGGYSPIPGHDGDRRWHVFLNGFGDTDYWCHDPRPPA